MYSANANTRNLSKQERDYIAEYLPLQLTPCLAKISASWLALHRTWLKDTLEYKCTRSNTFFISARDHGPEHISLAPHSKSPSTVMSWMLDLLASWSLVLIVIISAKLPSAPPYLKNSSQLLTYYHQGTRGPTRPWASLSRPPLFFISFASNHWLLYPFSDIFQIIIPHFAIFRKKNTLNRLKENCAILILITEILKLK